MLMLHKKCHKSISQTYQILLMLLYIRLEGIPATTLCFLPSPRVREFKKEVLIIIEYACLVTQSCPTLCDPMGRNPPGSSGHEIFQARILEWVATFYSRELEHKKT